MLINFAHMQIDCRLAMATLWAADSNAQTSTPNELNLSVYLRSSRYGILLSNLFKCTAAKSSNIVFLQYLTIDFIIAFHGQESVLINNHYFMGNEFRFPNSKQT